MEGNTLKLSKIGNIKIVLHRNIVGEIKTCSIIRDGKQWYASFAVECDSLQPITKNYKPIGVDVGLDKMVTLSNGDQVTTPKFYRLSENKLKYQQRKLSRKQLYSQNWRKQVDKLNIIYRKIRNQRNDFNHKLSRELIDKYDLIVFEDLQIKNMVKNKHLSKSIHDAAWSSLIQYTKYKAEEAGKLVELVNPCNTSQECSNCGTIIKKSIDVRIHKCTECGLIIDRDHNAAINILKRAVGTTACAC